MDEDARTRAELVDHRRQITIIENGKLVSNEMTQLLEKHLNYLLKYDIDFLAHDEDDDYEFYFHNYCIFLRIH